ncbi:UNVERIFIED_CONTAM: hypothetical protein K2H54_005112 [Gekko kuhli]
MEDGDRDPDDLPPDVNMADLTAGERAALTKARKKRVSALQRVGELLAARAWEDQREARREDWRDLQELLAELRAAQQEDQDARAAMLTAMDRSSNSTNELTRAVTLLVQTHYGQTPPSHSCQQGPGAMATQALPPKRPQPGTSSAPQWAIVPQPPQAGPTATGPSTTAWPQRSSHRSPAQTPQAPGPHQPIHHNRVPVPPGPRTPRDP